MSTIQFQDDWRSFGVGGDITEDGSFSNWKSSPKTNANKITPVMNDFNDFFSPSPRSSQPTCRPAATSLDKTLPKPCLTTSHMHTSLPSASAQPTNLWLGNSGSDTLLNTHCNHNQESINTSFDITEPTREDLGVSEEIEPLEIYIERESTQIAVVTSENMPMESLIDTVDHDTIQQSIDDLDLPKEVQPENATEQVQKFQASERKQSLDSLSCLESEQMSVQHPVSNPKEVQMDGLESQDQPILLECQDSIYEPTIADEPVQSIDSPTNSQTIESIENIEVPEESNEDDFGDFDDFDDFDDFEGFDDFGSIKEDDDFNCDDSPKVSVNKPPALRIDTTLGNTPLKAYTPPEDQIIFDNYNYRPVFISIKEAVEMWKSVLSEMDYTEPKSYTLNAPKSIKQLVLVEADESLHSRLTWTDVTHCMDNDTGVPKVRWSHSKIESMYLAALQCERDKSKVAVAPLTLRITTDKPAEEQRDIQTPVSSLPVHQVPSPVQTPVSVKPSSAGFGFSFSKLLPRLSTSSLPKSPVSPHVSFPQQHPLNQACLSQPCTPKASFDRQHIKSGSSVSATPNHGRSSSVSTLNSNHSRKLQNTPKRSSTIATDWVSFDDTSFLSQLDQPQVPAHSSPKTSHPQSSSMDILDFTDAVTVNSPNRPFFSSFTPLVPIKPSETNVQHRHTMPTELMSDWNSPPLSTSPKQTHPISFTSTVLSPVQTVQKHNQESTIGSPRPIIEPSKQTGPSWSDKPSKPTLQLEDFLSSKPTQPSEPQAKTQSPIQSLLPLDDFWSAKPVQTTKVMNSSPAPSPMDDFWSNAFIQTKPAEPVKHSYPAHSTQSFQTTHNVFGKQETLPNSVQNILPHTNTPSHTLQPDTKSSETTSDFDFGDFSSAPLGSQANNDDDFGDFESSSQHGDWPSTWVDTSNPTPFKQPTKEEDDWGEWATFK